MSDASNLKLVARALATARRGGFHPSAEELVAYAAGSLPAGRHDQVEEHFSACPVCARLVVDFSDFDELASPENFKPVTEADVAAARAKLDTALAASAAGSAHRTPPAASVSRPPTVYSSLRTWQLLAAALVLAVVGLAIWGGSEQRRLRRLRQPEVNVATLDLEPEGSDQVRGGPAAGPAVVDGSSGSSVLILQLPGVEEHNELKVAIRDSEGQVVWSRSGAVRDPVFGNFTLRLPPGALPPGRYTVEVFTDAETGGAPRARYPIEIR